MKVMNKFIIHKHFVFETDAPEEVVREEESKETLYLYVKFNLRKLGFQVKQLHRYWFSLEQKERYSRLIPRQRTNYIHGEEYTEICLKSNYKDAVLVYDEIGDL